MVCGRQQEPGTGAHLDDACNGTDIKKLPMGSNRYGECLVQLESVAPKS